MAVHVLIAEDFAGLRDALRTLLESEGYRVSTASDGLEALKATLWHQPDLLLTDIEMPGLTGWELFQRVRAAGCSVPVLFMSAEPSVAALALQHGATALVKPFDVDDLLTVLRRATHPLAA
jgi:two-component system response regulator MprA